MPGPILTRPVAVCTDCGAFTRSRSAIGQTCDAPRAALRARRRRGVFLVVMLEEWQQCRQCSGTWKNERKRCVRCQGTGWERLAATTKVHLEARELIKSLYKATDGK